MEDRILECCLGLFMKYGARNITMDDIASKIGASKKTIYQHFKDKGEIIRAVMRHDLEIQRKQTLEISALSADPIDEMFQITFSINQKLANINPTLLMEVQRYYPESWKMLEEFFNSFVYERIVDNLQRGVEAGLYRADLSEDLLGRYYIKICGIKLDTEVFPPDQFSPAQINTEITLHFLYGVSTQKGHELIDQYKSRYSRN